MIRKSIYVVLIQIALAMSSCSTPIQERDLDPTQARVSHDGEVAGHDSFAVQQCFDVKMEKWFEAFNRYQDQGMDMFQADQKAKDDAEKEHVLCSDNISKHMASERSPRKD